jgi:OHCU decarboxylase
MMSIGLHCRLIGRPGRIQALKRFIAYAQGHADVWFARRIDIAEHWAKHHPPVSGPKPSQMRKSDFVKRYGGIFEHSAWIAEAAYDLELGPAHDTALGLHNALTRVFRAAPETQRLEVLDAHPDLAGKLATAKRLTKESTSEQASAGLDSLTEGELTEFTKLNEDYTAKHGFPFIIAVRDYDKAGILKAFRARIDNDSKAEFSEACRQVERIAQFRLKEILL